MQKLHLISILVIAGTLVPAQTLAVETAEATLTNSLIKTAGMLALILILIYGLALLIKKSQKNFTSRARHLFFIESLPLGRNEQLCLIRSGDKYLVLGVTSHGIQRVDEIPASSIHITTSNQGGWQWAQQILQRH